MQKINLHLDTSEAIDPNSLRFNDSLLAPVPTFTKAQLKAFKCVLCNVVEYEGNPILFNLRNQRNVPKQFNPQQIGHKPLVAVLTKLSHNGLLKLEKGTPWYTKEEDGDFKDRKLSSFIPNEQLMLLAESAGITKESIEETIRSHVVLRDGRKNVLEYQPTLYTQHIEQLMGDYCDYLNQQRISVDGEPIERIFLPRMYKDWNGDGSFLFGGRSHHPFMSLSPTKRRRIKINGQATVSVDYPASVPNILYQAITGQRLYPEDPYQIKGIHRDIVKQYVNTMMNNSNRNSADKVVGTWLKIEATQSEQDAHAKAFARFRSRDAIMDAVLERNKPIRNCFFQGKATGQHYAWLETNLVFEVARYAVRWDIPALTVHDEFIVPEENEDGMNELLYTVGLDERIYDGDYLIKAIS